MSDEPRVAFEKDDGEKQQWVKWLTYKREGFKDVLVTSKAKWWGLALALAPLTFVALQPVEKAKPVSNVETPASATEQSIDVPALGERTANTRGSKSGSKPIKYIGPQVIVRPFMDAIPPGTMVRAVLISGASNGPVRAELQESVSVAGEQFAEAGSALLGFGQSNDDRLVVHFKKLVLRDGSVMPITAQACDGDDKIAGLRGQNVAGTALRTAGAVALGFVGGFAQGLQQTHAENGMEIKTPSLQNAALNGAATAALDQSRQMSDSLKEKRSVIEVKSGTPIFVLFEPNPKGKDNE